MRKLVAVVTAGLLGLGFLALGSSPASAELKTSISGSIRFNVIYSDVIPSGVPKQFIDPTTIPFTKGPGKDRERDNDQTVVDARRTRLQFDMSDAVGGIKISGRLQGDFDTDDGTSVNSNSRHFRIRLGWGQFHTSGGWIVRFGQIRSTLSEFGDNLFGGVADPDVLDENGHFDQQDGRSPGIQVGWTTKLMGGDLLVGVALERSTTSALTNTSATTSSNLAPSSNIDLNQSGGSDVPMGAAAIRYRTPLWAIFARGAVQRNKVIFGSAAGGQKRGDFATLTGWVGAFGAEVTPGPLRIHAQYWRGDGLNRGGNGTFRDIAVSASTSQFPNGINHLNEITTNNYHAGIDYKLTKDLKVGAVYEFMEALPNRRIFDVSATSTNQNKFQGVHANILYSFWTRFDVGVEYVYGKVNSFGSSEGRLNEVNTRLRFYF